MYIFTEFSLFCFFNCLGIFHRKRKSDSKDCNKFKTAFGAFMHPSVPHIISPSLQSPIMKIYQIFSKILVL